MIKHERIVIKQIEGENVWVTYMKDQCLNRNTCINAAITGKVGKGKSWGMLSLASQLGGENFKLEGNFFFKAGEMMRAVRDYYEREDLTEEEKKGKIWMLDEAGIDLNNMKYADAINKGLNAFFQTARHRNYIFFMTVPFMNFISKGVRTLMNAHFEAMGYLENRTIMLPRILDYNSDFEKYYPKRIMVETINGDQELCNDIRLKKPPKHIIEEYEKMKNEFTSDLFGKIADEIDVYEQKKQDKIEKYNKKKLTENQETILNLAKNEGLNEISLKLNKPKCVIIETIKAIEKKGYLFDPIKKGKKIIKYNVYDENNPPPSKPPIGFLPPDKAEEQRENLFDKKKKTNYVDWG